MTHITTNCLNGHCIVAHIPIHWGAAIINVTTFVDDLRNEKWENINLAIDVNRAYVSFLSTFTHKITNTAQSES